MLFEDLGLCQHIYKLLVVDLGQPIEQIGHIDLSHLLLTHVHSELGNHIIGR